MGTVTLEELEIEVNENGNRFVHIGISPAGSEWNAWSHGGTDEELKSKARVMHKVLGNFIEKAARKRLRDPYNRFRKLDFRDQTGLCLHPVQFKVMKRFARLEFD